MPLSWRRYRFAWTLSQKEGSFFAFLLCLGALSMLSLGPTTVFENICFACRAGG